MTNDTIFKIFKNYKWIREDKDYILIEHNNRYQFCIYICSDSFYKKIQTSIFLQKRKNCYVHKVISSYFIYIHKSIITQKLRQITINSLLNESFHNP